MSDLTRFVFVFLLAFIVGAMAGSGQQIEPQNLREIVIRNTAKISELDHDVRSLENWRDEFVRETDKTELQKAAEHRELQVKVDAHEKILWGLIGAFIVSFFGFLFGFLRQRTMHQDLHRRFEKLQKVN